MILVFGRTLLGSWFELCAFLSSLHWLCIVDDLGVGGVSFIELLILFERWAGEEVGLGNVSKLRRLHRQISVTTVLVGPSIDMWRSCRFLGAMIRALIWPPWWFGVGFLPCRIGANHCRLRSIGWERCGHGLTSRPLEASGSGFLDDLLPLCGYPSGSSQSLIDGSLRMRYCSATFSHKKPT